MNKALVSILALVLLSLLCTLLLQIQMTYHNMQLITSELTVIALGPISSYVFYISDMFNLYILCLFLLTAVLIIVTWFKLIRNKEIGAMLSVAPVFAWVLTGYGLSVWGAVTVDYPHF